MAPGPTWAYSRQIHAQCTDLLLTLCRLKSDTFLNFCTDANYTTYTISVLQ